MPQRLDLQRSGGRPDHDEVVVHDQATVHEGALRHVLLLELRRVAENDIGVAPGAHGEDLTGPGRNQLDPVAGLPLEHRNEPVHEPRVLRARRRRQDHVAAGRRLDSGGDRGQRDTEPEEQCQHPSRHVFPDPSAASRS